MAVEFDSEKELLEYAEKIKGHSFKEYDIHGRIKKNGNKGNLGQVVEEGFFGYDLNNNQEADFEKLGVELKVTPYKWVNNGKKVSSKERLVITNINYNEDYDKEFEDSHCYEKIKKILMMFYEHEKDKLKYDYIVSNIFMYHFDEMSEEDKLIIKNDYDTIMTKVRKGEAHLISETDTYYLAASTKGANAKKSMVSQPFSDIEAKNRAFSLKSSYMTQILRNYVFGENENRESFIKNLSLLRHKSLDAIIEDVFKPYVGKDLDEIDGMINRSINKKSKNYLASYVSAMMNVDEKSLHNLDEFVKADIKIKTIRINKRNSMDENMSFPAFKAKELVMEDWETSTLREQFLDEKYLFCIFDEIDKSKKEYRFRGVKLWAMPEKDLETMVREQWLKTKQILLEGPIFELKQQKYGKIIVKNNLPKQSDRKIVHVRPHTQKSIYDLGDGTVIGNGNIKIDGDELPDGRIMTKQCFFINREYIIDAIKDV